MKTKPLPRCWYLDTVKGATYIRTFLTLDTDDVQLVLDKRASALLGEHLAEGLVSLSSSL